jgi:hypothetical protein
MALRISQPKCGDFDYDGNCKPGSTFFSSQITFSVGIFQWIPTADGKNIKRSPVIHRIKGYSSEPEKVYTAAGIG